MHITYGSACATVHKKLDMFLLSMFHPSRTPPVPFLSFFLSFFLSPFSLFHKPTCFCTTKSISTLELFSPL
jgi:hypothetical protein